MPTKTVFLDTSGWLALLNASDSLHAIAGNLWWELGRQEYHVLVTDWVIAETGNGLARTAARGQFVAEVQGLRTSPRARVLPVSTDIFDRALALYGDRSDKTWGLVDCVSFVVMEDEGIQEAFTTDHHFEQAGFRRLLLQ